MASVGKGFSPSVMAQHHRNKEHIRNLCILAHVDHGKTTLADALLASNGIISARMAGKLRYMDTRDDEQARGITMKSSAVTLLHRYADEPYIINLIDSPGHVDFSSEVSTAVRLSDGAIVLVDVVEGVSAQTHVVLRQAWEEKVKPCLVLNKIDRLILELKLTPLEALNHLRRILEQVNAITAAHYASAMVTGSERRMETQERAATAAAAAGAANGDTPTAAGVAFEDEDWEDDTGLYFEPERGNVVFASAVDGWGFTVDHFAGILASKLKCHREPLARCLWGDYYLTKDQSGMRIKRGAEGKGKVPLFVRFVLDSIWDVYKACVEEQSKDRIAKIVSALGLKVPIRELQSSDSQMLAQSILSRWLPLAPAILDMACRALPSPAQLPAERATNLLVGQQSADSLSAETRVLCNALMQCDVADTAPVIAFVSKMVPVEISDLPERQVAAPSMVDVQARRDALIAKRRAAGLDRAPGADTAENDGTPMAPLPDSDADADASVKKTEGEGASPAASGASPSAAAADADPQEKLAFIAYTRVYSGVLRPGMKIHVLAPKYDPLRPDKYRTEVTIGNIYLFMGRSLLPLQEAPAGTVVGIGGLDADVLKSATLSSTPTCPALTGLYHHVTPIVRVALETESIADMPALKRGMRLLNLADACVQVFVQETGEHVMVGAGEVHIERCLTDLRTQFAPGIKIRVSPPIISFRETVVEPPKVDRANEEIGAENKLVQRDIYLLPPDVEVDESKSVTVTTSNKRWRLTVRAKPLPTAAIRLMSERSSLLRAVSQRASDMRDGIVRHQARQPTGSEESGVIGGETAAAAAAGEGNDDAIRASPSPAASTLLSADTLAGLEKELLDVLGEAGSDWEAVVPSILAFGPRNMGANILVNRIADLPLPGVFDHSRQAAATATTLDTTQQEILSFANAIAVGFQLLTQAGPLCDEPVMGVAFELLGVTIEPSAPVPDSSFGGIVIAAAKEAFRQAFLVQPVRLMTAIYACDLFVNSSSLGKVYAVLNKRHGRVISEEMKEGTDSFQIHATLPVTDSFGFAEELRRRTSGLAVPQLIFSHWEVIDDDPFWVPTTEEELLHFGEKGDRENVARKHMDDVRRRKGLHVEEKIVEHAEKQRNISRKK